MDGWMDGGMEGWMNGKMRDRCIVKETEQRVREDQIRTVLQK